MCEFRKCAMAVIAAAVMVVSVQTGARAEDRRIAVVNVSEVFLHYDRVKQVQEDLAAKFKPEQEKLQKKESQLKSWKENLEVKAATGGNPKDRTLLDEKQKLEMAVFDLQLEYDKLTETVEKRRKDEMQLILTEIKRVIAVIAKQQKFDLVLRAPEYGGDFDPVKAGARRDDEATSAQELVRRFRDNPVLYFAEGTEITQGVISMLNADYKAAPK